MLWKTHLNVIKINYIYYKSFICFKLMAWGRFRKVWEKIKGAAKKVGGFIKKIIIPIAKVAAPAIGAAVGGAAGAQWGNTIVDAVDKGIGVVFPSFNTTKEAAVYKSPGGGLNDGLGWKQ
jgi:hypothetical protein